MKGHWFKAKFLQRVAGLALVFIVLDLHQEVFGQRTTALPVPPSSSTQREPEGMTQGGERITVNTDVVTLTVTVMDAQGRYVLGLDKSAFTVTDNKIPQEIEYFSDDDLPVSIGVVFDTSGSMSGQKIIRAQEALSLFIQTSRPDDEYFLIGFNSSVELLVDRTRDSDAILGKLTFVETRGQTALYDAAYLGVEKVKRGTHTKRAILIISDGQDNNSRYNFDELRRLVRESDTLIYAVGIQGPTTGHLDVYGKLLLDELASTSGGRAFFPNNTEEMYEAFEQIALELRRQYSIGYRPSNFSADGRWHRVKVKVTPPAGVKRLFVRNREGYYAAPSSH